MTQDPGRRIVRASPRSVSLFLRRKASYACRIRRCRNEDRRGCFAVELVGVHDNQFLAGFCQVVGNWKRKALIAHVVAAEADARVTRTEPGYCLGQSFFGKEFMPEQTVPYIL